MDVLCVTHKTGQVELHKMHCDEAHELIDGHHVESWWITSIPGGAEVIAARGTTVAKNVRVGSCFEEL